MGLRSAIGGWVLAVALSGCAGLDLAREDRDPFEDLNRLVYHFNDGLDKAVLKPLAEYYVAAVPVWVDNGVTNVFGNAADVATVANDLLQGKLERAAMDVSRVVWNTTLGLGGWFDVATHMGLPRGDEDFGQTLGVWGVGDGYYLVLPLVGPSGTRDIWRIPVDGSLDPLEWLRPAEDYTAVQVLKAIDQRAGLLRAERALAGAALDPYTFMRESYRQRRLHQIHDGKPPRRSLDDF